MIFTRLAGGLGNQLFQLSASLALQESCGGKVFLGTESLRRYKVARDFDLARLLKLPDFCLAEPNAPGWAGAAERLMALRLGRLLPTVGVNDRNFALTLARTSAARTARNLWLDGYFQQGWAWPEFAPVLASMVAMQRDDMPAPPWPMPDCTVHVRGGDFLASEVHHVVDPAFYCRAMGMLLHEHPNTGTVWIVTDDKSHASAVRSALSAAYAQLDVAWAPEGPGGWMHDFALLREASTRILGNSTFSWWAAALDRRQGRTFTPSQWARGVPRSLYLRWEMAVPV
jgi:hypothetical protein